MWWTCLAVGGVTVWTTPGEPRHADSAAVPCAADPPRAAGLSETAAASASPDWSCAPRSCTLQAVTHQLL